MTLAHLSMAHFKQVNGKKQHHPHVRTNAERLQAYRSAVLPTTEKNVYPWPHLQMKAKA